MREVFLGEYMKQRRLELGLTQEQLCEGICEPMTISRMENGRQTPSRNRINALLQRLGLPNDRYFALLSKREEEIAALQKEIIACSVQRNTAHGWELLAQLEQITESDDHVTRQFILRSKVILGKAEGRYSAEKQLQMLMEALRMTVPHFDLEEISSGLYSFEEIKIINQIAINYAGSGQRRKAIDILRQLMKYVQKHYQNILQSGGLLPLISYNYARELAANKQYEDAIEIAELGWQSCVSSGHYQFLPGILAIMSSCNHFLEKDKLSASLYHQSYYLYKAVDNPGDCETIKKEAMEYLNIDFQF